MSRGVLLMTSALTKASACLPIFTALALLLAARSASSTEEEPYLVEYRAYNEALAAGDGHAAVTHALAAWQAAENALGDHKLTAILAYNYGRLILFDDSENARTSLRRARELHEAGVADLSANEVLLYSNYAEFSASRFKRREANRLRETLETIEAGAAEANPDLAAMWLSLASSDIAAERFRKAQKSAARAEAAILSATPESSHSLAAAILFGGVARVVPYPRTVDDVQAAHNEFRRARRLFPSQESLESFDPMLAKVLAWDSATNAALRTLGLDDYPDHADSETGEALPLPPLFDPNQDAPLDCGEVEWLEREAPRFPSDALRQGTIGAVFVGYRLGDDLRVRDARVLAEVPNDEFGDEVLEVMAKWRVKELPPGGPACYRNLTTHFRFVIEN